MDDPCVSHLYSIDGVTISSNFSAISETRALEVLNKKAKLWKDLRVGVFLFVLYCFGYDTSPILFQMN